MFQQSTGGGQGACRNDVSWQCITDVWSRNRKADVSVHRYGRLGGEKSPDQI